MGDGPSGGGGGDGRGVLGLEQAPDLVEAVSVLHLPDPVQAAEDRFVEEPLAAGRTPALADQPDGGVVVDRLPRQVEVVGYLGGAVQFRRQGERVGEVAVAFGGVDAA